MTYGLRWDVEFVPHSLEGPSLPAVTGFNLNHFSDLALAAPGTPPYESQFGNVAPRLGLAYAIRQRDNWQTVLRAGGGIFYDMATQEIGNGLIPGVYPFGSNNFSFGGSFPLDPAAALPPPVAPSNLTSIFGGLFALDPHLKLPYTAEWNIAVEQGLGTLQSISVSYLGAAGKRLLQSEAVSAPNPSFASAKLVSNVATSDYDALQVQFRRQVSKGFQALASYTWSHSIDTSSAGSTFNEANALTPTVDSNLNRGSSDFDVRHAFTTGTTYDVPAPEGNKLLTALLGAWSLENLLQARSAPPVNLFDGAFAQLFTASAQIRPDRVAGQPLYLFGGQYPGGKAINQAAFAPPPIDSNGNALRQGDLGRNALRGFGAFQWDFSIHREFSIHESVKLQFRAEMFNLLNHPNFGPPVSDLNDTQQFGRATQMLGRSLDSSNQGGGSFSPLYQIGGPRSIQVALKLAF
jgi:hypothetical protein